MTIDGIRSPFRFEGVIRQAVYDLKYHNLRAISGCLAKLMASYLRETPIPADVLVPVPIHLRRLRERGYNQSILLARELGKLIDLPVVVDCLLRVKDSLPQARTTSVEQRQRNVTDAFVCNDKQLSGRHVLLIDDVSTSCATLEACARALKSAGVFSVYGLTLAREILTKEINL